MKRIWFSFRPDLAMVVLFGRAFHSCRLSPSCAWMGKQEGCRRVWFDTWKTGQFTDPAYPTNTPAHDGSSLPSGIEKGEDA